MSGRSRASSSRGAALRKNEAKVDLPAAGIPHSSTRAPAGAGSATSPIGKPTGAGAVSSVLPALPRPESAFTPVHHEITIHRSINL
eukprot:scaffold97157_cov29-Tisochrysis_lutea.AAC.4